MSPAGWRGPRRRGRPHGGPHGGPCSAAVLWSLLGLLLLLGGSASAPRPASQEASQATNHAVAESDGAVPGVPGDHRTWPYLTTSRPESLIGPGDIRGTVQRMSPSDGTKRRRPKLQELALELQLLQQQQHASSTKPTPTPKPTAALKPTATSKPTAAPKPTPSSKPTVAIKPSDTSRHTSTFQPTALTVASRSSAEQLRALPKSTSSAEPATGGPATTPSKTFLEDINNLIENLPEKHVDVSVRDSHVVTAGAGGYGEMDEEEQPSYEAEDMYGPNKSHVDLVNRFLRIVESQHLLGENCTAGTDLNLGEGVVDRYAQERFRVEADVAVNRANMLTRLWKYAGAEVLHSEYLLHAAVFAMVEFDDDIFAAGNCYDAYQYKDYELFCPFAYRLPDGPILVKDLAVEYKYLGNSSEWFFIARKNAERVIHNYNQFSRGFNTYTFNSTAHTERVADEILSVTYEDGKWSKPYYDCGGGNIWMLTYTVPFFGFANGTYHFKGTSGIDIDLRRVDIDQCPSRPGSTELNIFAASDKCKKRTTECEAIKGLGFRRGSYQCVCRKGFYFPETKSSHRAFNGSHIEEEYEKLQGGQDSEYALPGAFECLQCAEGCESCEDSRPCVLALNWAVRTALLVLSCAIILCLPAVLLFTWKYQHVKVVRAASPVLLRVIVLGAFFIYCTTIVSYFKPRTFTCTLRLWLRELGFSLTYGALMFKTWRISVIFRVRSAKAVKITDVELMQRVGAVAGMFGVLLAVRTLVDPPPVIVGRTADDLKAFLCRTDWWDHCFTVLELSFLLWGVRLCIVVRKAPTEFNEARFISMAIYNEFLLSIFLNVSMFFLQSSANPDLLFIILFAHTQLTVTLLLALIFGSKAYLVFRCRGRPDEVSGTTGTTGPTYNAADGSRAPTTKFSHLRAECQQKYDQPAAVPALPPAQGAQGVPSSTSASAQSGHQASANGSATQALPALPAPPQKAEDEFCRLRTELESLHERCLRGGEARLADLLKSMLEEPAAPVQRASVGSQADAPPPPPPPPPPPLLDQDADRQRDHEQRSRDRHGSRERDRERDRDRDRGLILRPTLLTVRELRVIQKSVVQPAGSRPRAPKQQQSGGQLDNARSPRSPASPMSPLSQLSPLSQTSPLCSPGASEDANGNANGSANGMHVFKDSNHNDKPSRAADDTAATVTLSMATDEVTV